MALAVGRACETVSEVQHVLTTPSGAAEQEQQRRHREPGSTDERHSVLARHGYRRRCPVPDSLRSSRQQWGPLYVWLSRG